MEFWDWVQRHFDVTHIKVQKGSTEIGEPSSLIRNFLILRYIVIRTKQYVVMYDLRRVVEYFGAVESLLNNIYKTHTKH